jgi:hypothetical protein
VCSRRKDRYNRRRRKRGYRKKRGYREDTKGSSAWEADDSRGKVWALGKTHTHSKSHRCLNPAHQ